MKVLHWLPYFLPDIGGAEVFASHLLPLMNEKGVEVRIITSQGKDNTIESPSQYKGIPVYRFDIRGAVVKRDPHWIFDIKNNISTIIDAFDPDISHLHLPNLSSLIYPLLGNIKTIPTIITLHSSLSRLDSGLNTMIGRIVRQSEWVCGVSKHVIEDAIEQVPEINARASVIYNGVELSKDPPPPLDFDPPVLLCIGRMISTKGFDTAINAFRKVKNKFPKSIMYIVGDGPFQDSLKQLAVRIGCEGAIDFIGWVNPDKIGGWIDRSTILLIPSMIPEGFPMVALEGGARGRPIMATDLGGLLEIILDGETGILYKNKNSDQLAALIIKLLDQPDLAIEMGLGARRRIEEHFSIENSLESYHSLYKELKNGR